MSGQTFPRWLLALESSTPNGGAALLRDGDEVAIARLSAGLRHGRELMPAAAALLADQGLAARDLWAVAVSVGPGSYTGIRVGVMAAKALAYGVGCRLAAVSSLASLAASLFLSAEAADASLACVVQDARRDEVYLGIYRRHREDFAALVPDSAVTPEEAAERLQELLDAGESPLLGGSGFTSYADLFTKCCHNTAAASGAVNPAAVGFLGWRQLLREKSADPLLLQPEYLRRDSGHDWTHDKLIGRP